MKKLIFTAILAVFGLVGNYAYGQENKGTVSDSFITGEEYRSADTNTQRLADLLNAAIGALDAYNTNGKGTNVSAEIFYSLDEKDTFSNFVILAPFDEDGNSAAKRMNAQISLAKNSCYGCGISGAFNCGIKIRNYMLSNNLTELDIHVSVNWHAKVCATITW